MKKVSFKTEKVQKLMKENGIKPRDLRKKAVISTTYYKEIMQTGVCDIATLGRISNALDTFLSKLTEE